MKTKLRAAFDQQIKADLVAPVAPVAPVLTFAPTRSRRSARLWIAAAALILISIGVVSLSGLPGAAPSNSTVDMSDGGKQAQREQSQPPVIEPGNQRIIDEPRNQQNIDTDVAGKASTERRARRRAAISDDMTAITGSVTDYIPLTYLADAADVESGTVLRVELPPSALITMGLPMNVDRTDSRVKADLIVGDDGVPRAVRFVGEDSSKEIRR
ncbi:MAG TPA: hypothetical protein VFY40_12710 [Blastocatellia bacterium]|nr:hypothetical protein [Blastocatellia bacterium]